MAWPRVTPSPSRHSSPAPVTPDFDPPLNIAEWSFVVIADTHTGLKCSPENMLAMSEWIVANARKRNIRFVGHTGDVAHENSLTVRLKAARDAIQPLVDVGLPFLFVPGNHDYDVSSYSRPATVWNTEGYFGLDLYEPFPWYGGSFEHEVDTPGTDPGGTINTYITLDIAGRQYLILGLEMGPRDKVMEWADDLVLRRYPDHEVMVFTHSYLARQDHRVTTGTQYNPKGYEQFSTDPGPEYTNDGEDMWQKYLKHWPRLRAVFSGHDVYSPRQAHLVSYGEHGNKVNQFFANWQDWGKADGVWGDRNNGDYYGTIVRIYTVNLVTGEVGVENYSPPADEEGESVSPTEFEYV